MKNTFDRFIKKPLPLWENRKATRLDTAQEGMSELVDKSRKLTELTQTETQSGKKMCLK